MSSADIYSGGGLRWMTGHWWSSHCELRQDDELLAWVRIKGSRGTAGTGGREYKLQRFRLRPYITLRDGATDELVARFALIPKSGFLAEFDDGESFRFGWVNWLRREWNWTDESGHAMLASRRPWLGGIVELRVDPSSGERRKWPLLAILEIGMAKLAIPWF